MSTAPTEAVNDSSDAPTEAVNYSSDVPTEAVNDSSDAVNKYNQSFEINRLKGIYHWLKLSR